MGADAHGFNRRNLRSRTEQAQAQAIEEDRRAKQEQMRADEAEAENAWLRAELERLRRQ